jgi:hypothetical protein
MPHDAGLSGPGVLSIAPRRLRVMGGIAISLVLHIAMLALLRDRANIRNEPEPPRMTVEILLLPPPAPPRAITPPRDADTPRRDRARPPKHHAAPHTDTVPATPPAAAASPPVRPDSTPTPPTIDPEAARAAIPGILKQLDDEKRKLPVGQLMDKPLYGPEEESRLGRQMARAGRPDCMKDGRAGLLTPLLWLAEKKGTGCKW